jgi:hypothetical protein
MKQNHIVMKQNHKLALVLIGAAAFALAPRDLAQAANLVQYWHFEEVGAATATNALPGGNPALLVNVNTNTCWLSDVASQLTNSTASVYLDGVAATDDYIDLGNVYLNDSATFSCWIKPWAMATDTWLFSPMPPPSNYGGLIHFDPLVSGYIQVNNGGPWINLAPAATVPVGQWTHLALAYGSGLVSMYANGQWVGTSPAIFPFDQCHFCFGQTYRYSNTGGSKSSGVTFDGAVDEVSFWDGPLSANSIALLAAGVAPTAITDLPPAPPPGANLVQYFTLDDGPGSATASNSVVGGNVGTLVNLDPGTAWITNGLPSPLTNDLAALSFNNTVSSNWVNLGNLALAGAGTISLWINPEAYGSNMCVYSQTTGGTGLPGAISFVGIGGLQCWNGIAWVRVASDGAVPTNQWSHLAVTYSGGVTTAFVNGVPQISGRAGFFFVNTVCGLGAPFQLASGNPFAGLINDVSIWDQALSPTSIGQLALGVSPLDIVDVPEPKLPPISLTAMIITGAPPKLTQYFPLEGSPGSTTVANAVAGGNTGALVNYTYGALTWESTNLCPLLVPRSTTALFFNGTNNYANLGNIKLNGSGTVSFWVNPSTLATSASGGTQRLFSPATTTSYQQGALGVNPDGTVWVSDSGGFTYNFGPPVLTTNQWYHLAVTYIDGLATLFVNGAQIGTAPSGLVFNQSATELGGEFGNTYGSTFAGLMDDVAIWNAPLSLPSIQQLAAGASPQSVAQNMNQVILSWPAYPGTFIVQSTDDLSHGWSNVSVNWPATLSGSTYSVTLPVSSQCQFYRLKKSLRD